MKVGIISSGSTSISNKYIDETNKICNILVDYDFDLVYGADFISMMGECYNVFKKNNKKIYGYVTKKYSMNAKKILGDKCFILDNTFLVKEKLYIESDMIVCLPGGIGTKSELLSFICEKKDNDNFKPIIIYDPFDDYKSLIDVINNDILSGFTKNDINNYFIVCKNEFDFKKALDEKMQLGNK